MSRPDASSLRTLLDTARHVSILLPQKPDFDTVAAALGLKVSLESTGKNTKVVCAAPMLVEFNRLVGVESVVDTFGSRNLIISFPGQTEHVDKVSYNLEKGELQLVITPKSDSPDLEHGKLRFISGSGKTDLIILIGISEFPELGPVYSQAKEYLSSTTVVSISHKTPKENLTLHQLHDYEASSLSELVTHIIESSNMNLSEDAASNLLIGIEKATRNFQHPSVTLTTFEAAVVLMRKGAKRHIELSASDFPPGAIPDTSSEEQTVVVAAPPPSNQSSSVQLGYGTDSDIAIPVPTPKKNKSESKPPADWYEPKIFKGPMLP